MMPTPVRSVLVLACCSLVVASAPGAISTSRQAAIEALIKARVEEGGSIGIVAATIEPDGSTVVAGYGEPGLGALPLDGDSVFEIGSITKVFTAAVLAEMAARGEVRLDDPVQKYLPAAVTMPQRNGRAITLVDLATHMSGLPRMPTNFAPANPQNPFADYTAERLYAFLAGHQLARDAGAQHEYSNVGAGLLGHALARRAGVSFESLVSARILKPLGMTRTGVTLTPWMKAHLVRGHNRTGVIVSNWDGGVLEGAGALRSTARDMLQFARANLDGSGSGLARVLRSLHDVRASTGRGAMAQALGWLVRQTDGRAIHWHNGGTGGYRTWIGLDVARGTAAVVLTNSLHGADDLGFELLK